MQVFFLSELGTRQHSCHNVTMFQAKLVLIIALFLHSLCLHFLYFFLSLNFSDLSSTTLSRCRCCAAKKLLRAQLCKLFKIRFSLFLNCTYCTSSNKNPMFTLKKKEKVLKSLSEKLIREHFEKLL